MGPEAYILIDHAYEAYRQGRFVEAGVLAGQTCNDAKKAGKDELAYELGLFEVQCLLRAGKPLGALNRLLTMESWQAPLHEYLFQMKEQTFDLLRSYNPDVTQLETRLGELERLARSALDGVVADFRLYEYLYLEDQGKDEKALNSIELAWSERGAGTMNHAHSTASVWDIEPTSRTARLKSPCLMVVTRTCFTMHSSNVESPWNMRIRYASTKQSKNRCVRDCLMQQTETLSIACPGC